jgi:hypothetical protein
MDPKKKLPIRKSLLLPVERRKLCRFTGINGSRNFYFSDSIFSSAVSAVNNILKAQTLLISSMGQQLEVHGWHSSETSPDTPGFINFLAESIEKTFERRVT